MQIGLFLPATLVGLVISKEDLRHTRARPISRGTQKLMWEAKNSDLSETCKEFSNCMRHIQYTYGEDCLSQEQCKRELSNCILHTYEEGVGWNRDCRLHSDIDTLLVCADLDCQVHVYFFLVLLLFLVDHFG